MAPTRREARRAERLQFSLVALLKASPVLHRAAYKVVAHWLLLRASTAYNKWAAYVRARVWRRRQGALSSPPARLMPIALD